MTTERDALPSYDGPLPWLTTRQMAEVDRLMIESARILLLQMMENAGRHLAHLARVRFLGGDPRGRSVTVLAGTGGNGGGVLVAARRLSAWGARVRVAVTDDDPRFKTVPRHQLVVARRAGIEVVRADAIPEGAPDLVLDGVLGYGVEGNPRGEAEALIRWANGAGAPILSLDNPSGLDTTTGRAFDPAVHATATLTLALPKEGLRRGDGPGLVGELYLADIGVPPAVYAAPTLGFEVATGLFARADIVRITTAAAG